MLLHERDDFDDPLVVVSREEAIDPGLVEKDYWIMHALWGLQQLGFDFDLKGGTSLAKGYGLIHRFSEDFPAADNKVIADNPAFHLDDSTVRRKFERAYNDTAALYYRGQPSFNEILGRIQDNAERL